MILVIRISGDNNHNHHPCGRSKLRFVSINWTESKFNKNEVSDIKNDVRLLWHHGTITLYICHMHTLSGHILLRTTCVIYMAFHLTTVLSFKEEDRLWAHPCSLVSPLSASGHLPILGTWPAPALRLASLIGFAHIGPSLHPRYAPSYRRCQIRLSCHPGWMTPSSRNLNAPPVFAHTRPSLHPRYAPVSYTHLTLQTKRKV